MSESWRDPEPSERERIEEHQRWVAAAQQAMPELAVPCFALLRVEHEGRSRAHLLGPRTQIARELSVIDWRSAPLSEVFFSTAEGEDFEIGIDGRPITGTVLEKSLLSVERGELVETERGGTICARHSGGWKVLEGGRPPILRAIPRGARRGAREAMVALDPAQRLAVERPDRALLILGEAGFGKTTVALHRLARLEAEAREAGRRFRALVVVPTEGLLRLSRLLLERLGVARVEVATFDDFVLTQARRIFRGLPARDARGVTAGIVRVKRHPALRVVLPEIAPLDEKRARRKDLLHLFGDRDLLERAASAAGGAIPRHAIDEVLEHTHVQFSRTTEHESRHIDADRLETLDGLLIDEGTPLEDAESIDAEDGAVLFEIHRLRGGSEAALKKYDHLVIDEAQELAPLELAFLSRVVVPGGSITVAGDEQQQIDDTACFPGWEAAMAELGLREHGRVLLTESYRCPPEVTRYARALFTERQAAEAERARSPRSGRSQSDPEPGTSGPLVYTGFPNACHRLARLIDELLRLERESPRASIAIITKTSEAARRMQADLRGAVATRLALGGDFDFLPGVVITSIPEVKGLEFDVVILPDAERRVPDDPQKRKALYVAVTRALRQVWMLGAG